MRDISIDLTWSEVLSAATTGLHRQLEAVMQQRPDRHGYDGSDGWTAHIEGACGEVAVAKALGLYWGATLNTFKDGGDIGERIEVRTRSKAHYELIVRADDKDDSVFILVVGKAPRYRVVGWIRGRDAKNPLWSQTHGNRPAAYFVPQAQLKAFAPSAIP